MVPIEERKYRTPSLGIRPMIITVSILVVSSVVVGLILGYYTKISLLHTFNSLCFNFEQKDKNIALSQIQKCAPLKQTNNSEIFRYRQKCETESCRAVTCTLPLPRTYVVYHLAEKKIRIDGLLDEAAWEEVPWIEDFQDIRGKEYPKPVFQTRVKLRWDDSYLYFGARLEDTDIWANRTLHDTKVYEDNALQILLDSDQSHHKYKEIVMNALGTVSDTMLSRPYLDDGEPLALWDSQLIRAIYIEGQINKPQVPDKYWQVELAVPFKTLLAGTQSSKGPPKNEDVWRANFVRSNWETDVSAGKYQKKSSNVVDWWVWNSPGVTNIHLPDRWGLLQFRTSKVINISSFKPDLYWSAREALNEIYTAEKAFKATTGRYTDRLDRLNLSPYIVSGQCIQTPEIELDSGGFVARIKPSRKDLIQINIRTDRYVWFGKDF